MRKEKMSALAIGSKLKTRALEILSFTMLFAAQRKLTQVAASLTFTTVLAIVPLLAVVLALFTAFPLFAQFHQALENFLSESLLPPAVAANIMQYLNQFASQASGLTAVGGAFLVVTSIMLIMTIDGAFNEIWNVQRQRPMQQRLLIYWAIISLGPIFSGASIWASATLLRESLGYVADLPEIVSIALRLMPFFIAILSFTALYMFVPNCKVNWRDALYGGVGASVVLSIMKAGFTWYLTKFPSYTIIYGAFAVLPIFLLWLYLSWLVILMGATIASLLPALRLHIQISRHFAGKQMLDSLIILQMLWAKRNQQPAGCQKSDLEAELRIHPEQLEIILGNLRALSYAVPAADSDNWVMTCDPEQKKLGQLFDKLLLDRSQPGFTPKFRQALSAILQDQDPTLDEVFTTTSGAKKTNN